MADQKGALTSPLSVRKWPPMPPEQAAAHHRSGRPAGPSGTASAAIPTPARPGTAGGGRVWSYVEARFPYEYENDQGRLVRMACGDRYRLVNRSNAEWWQVIPLSLPEHLVGDGPEAISDEFLLKHSFYIPAKYVELMPEPPSPANSLDRFCGDIRPSSHKRQGSTGTSSSATPDWRDDSGASNDGLEAALGPSAAASGAPSATAAVTPYPLPTPRRPKGAGESTATPQDGSFASSGASSSGPSTGQKAPVSAAFLSNLESKIGSLSRAENQGGSSSAGNSQLAPDDDDVFVANVNVPFEKPRGILKTSSLPLSGQRAPPSPPSSSSKPHHKAVTPDEAGKEIIYANIPPHHLTSSMPSSSTSTSSGSRLSNVWELPGLKQIGRETESLGSDLTEDRDRPTISAPVLDLQTAEKRGHLAKTKVMENSKRVKKNWTQHFVLLRGPCLYFYKDQKAPKSGQPHGKAEFTLSLETVKMVPVDSDLTNRKNVIALEDRGAPGSSVVYYLQCEDAMRKNEWTMAIQMAKALANRKGGDLVPANPIVFGASPKRRSLRRKGTSGSTPEGGPNAAQTPSAESVEKQTVMSLLMDFFRRRQPVESLQAKGIIRNEPVFGSTLAELADKEGTDGVPTFVQRAIEAIERREGLTTQGIYRVNGNGATIQRLRCLVDQTSEYDLMDAQWELEVLTGALKLFFRELKEPLIPCSSYDRFVNVLTVKEKNRISAAKKLINSLPPVHLKTMKHLFHHLDRVVQFSGQNQMHLRNVAIVFGPNLLWPAVKTANNSEGLTATVMWQNQIVEFLLSEATDLFNLPPPLPHRAADEGPRRG